MAINHGVLSEKGNGKDQAVTGEVDSQTDQRIVDEGGSTKWPSSTTHSSPALNPGEVNYTDQRKQVLHSAGCFCLSALEGSTTGLD